MRICGIEAGELEARALVDALRDRRDAVLAAQIETALNDGRDLEPNDAMMQALRDVFRHGTPPGLTNFRDDFLDRD